MKKVKVKMSRMLETFGCEVVSDYIPQSQLRVFTRLGLGTRVLKVKKRQNGLTASGAPNLCHDNSALLKKTFGGRHIKGYWIVPLMEGVPSLGTQMIWHSIWITPEGVAIDPTMTRDELDGEVSRDYSMFIPVAEVTEKLFVTARDFVIPHNPKEKGVLLTEGFDGDHKREAVTIGELSQHRIYETGTPKTHNGIKEYNSSLGEGSYFTKPSTATNRVLNDKGFALAA